LVDTIRKDPLWSQLYEWDYKTRIDSLIQDIRVDIEKRYCLKLEDYYKQHERKRYEEESALDNHIKWTVQVRVLCRNWDERNEMIERLAHEENLTRKAIEKGVRETLLEMDLPLKPTFRDSKGQPPKVKS
jgi:hypothetical protein